MLIVDEDSKCEITSVLRSGLVLNGHGIDVLNNSLVLRQNLSIAIMTYIAGHNNAKDERL
jgi:hypothetical protein